MKKRYGFVSNSSSSSFVVVFPRKPKSENDVREMLFHKGDSLYPIVLNEDFSERQYPVEQVARTVFELIKSQTVNNKHKILNEFLNGNLEGDPEFPFNKLSRMPKDEISKKLNNEIYAKYNAEMDTRHKKLYEEFMNKYSNEYIYIFVFSDNDGDYDSALEHSGLFRRLEGHCFSHH